MAEIIEILHLDFAYGGPLVLAGIDLSVQRGATLGLIGPNGGGKTTLVKLLLGLLRPTGGSIRVDGLTPAAAVRQGDVIGYVPQNTDRREKFPLSVRQAVHLGLAGKTGMLRNCPTEDRKFADFLIGRVGMGALVDQPVGQLSGGQLQRVLIARALSPRPKILLLDEPTTGIDRRGQEEFTEFLLELKKELDLTIVIVSHDLRTVSAMSDRIACLNVSLHCHDVPHRLPADVIFRMFSCDLQAMGIGQPACDHDHAAADGIHAG